MIKIAKISLIASTIAITTFANFAYAQTASVSAADLQVMQKLSVDIRNAKNKGSTSQEYLDLRQKGMEMCADIGKRLFVVTGSKPGTSATTAWAEAANSCNFATYVGKGTPSDFLGIQLKRDFVIQEDVPGNTPGGILYNQILFNSKTPLTQAQYDRNVKTVSAVINSDATITSAFDKVTNIVITTITNILTGAVLALTALGGMLIDFANNQTSNALLPDIVDKGWTITRDLMNMVFILALIIISIATILRRPENLNARKTILNLILMALLINFSRVIAETLIGASDAVGRIFLAGTNLNSYGQLFSGLVTQGGSFFYTNGAYGSGSAATQGVAKIIVAMAITAGYLGIAGIIVVRLIGLWILTIFSPIAFALNVLPQTKAYSKQWWDTFIKYLIWFPVIMFFMYLINLIIIKKGTGYIVGSVADYILIAALMAGATIFTRKSGIYGADKIMNYAQQGGRMASKYILRGSAVRHAGIGLEKVTGGGRVSSAIKTAGEKWQRTAQYTEAAPGAVKTMFNKAEENYKKGVSSAGKEILYKTGFVEDKEMLKSPKDTYRIFQDKLKSDKFTVNDMHDLINEMPRKSIAGAIQALSESERADLKPEANLALLEKIGERNAAPGTDLLREHPYGPMAYGATGFQYVDPEDKSKGMNISYYRFNKNRNEVETQPQIRRYNANEKASELDSLSAQQRAATDQQYKEFKEALKKRSDHEKALGNNPDRENKIREAETKGEIIDSNRVKTYQKFVDAYDGAGDATVEIKQSIVTDTGKVMLNSEAAEALGVAQDQDRYFPKEQFSELKQALQTHGGVSPEDLQKLEVGVQNLGGIQTQRGVVKPLEPIIREQLNAQGVKNFRVAQRQEKEHEGIHRFSDFIKQSNKQLAQDITNKIINTDKTKFEELKNEIKKIPAYATQDLSDEDIAGEIISQAKFRNQLNPDLTKEINQSIQSLKKEYMKAVFTTARTNKFMSRTGVLADKISNRDPKLEEATHVVRRL
jgi:hypothetical protein